MIVVMHAKINSAVFVSRNTKLQGMTSNPSGCQKSKCPRNPSVGEDFGKLCT